MIRLHNFLALFFSLCTLVLNAQVNFSDGGIENDYGYQVEVTTDGGFIVAGKTLSFGAGNTDYWLVKFDSLAAKQWDTTYGSPSYDEIFSLRLASDQSYLIAGYSGVLGGNFEAGLMYKIDSAGQVVWEKTLHHGSREHAHVLIENYEGGYYMAGHSESFGNSGGSAWVVKLDSARNVIWDSIYSPVGVPEHGHSAVLTPDSGLAVLAHTIDNNYTKWKLFKIDKHGNLQWSEIYSGGSNANDEPSEIRLTSQGHYAMFGYSQTFAGVATYWLKVVDSVGNNVIDRHYGTGASYCWSGRETSDKGFVLVGYKHNGIFGGTDMLVIKTDSLGNVTGSKQYGGASNDVGYGLAPWKDRWIYVGGTVSFTTGGQQDLWVVIDSLPESLITNIDDQKSSVRVFPNPAGGIVQIDLGGSAGEKRVTVFDQFGQLLSEQITSENQLQLDVIRLASGIYFLQFEVDGSWITSKLSVQH